MHGGEKKEKYKEKHIDYLRKRSVARPVRRNETHRAYPGMYRLNVLRTNAHCPSVVSGVKRWHSQSPSPRRPGNVLRVFYPPTCSMQWKLRGYSMTLVIRPSETSTRAILSRNLTIFDDSRAGKRNNKLNNSHWNVHCGVSKLLGRVCSAWLFTTHNTSSGGLLRPNGQRDNVDQP
jgi:hypothetical protein